LALPHRTQASSDYTRIGSRFFSVAARLEKRMPEFANSVVDQGTQTSHKLLGDTGGELEDQSVRPRTIIFA
jgi:hypothetical protein